MSDITQQCFANHLEVSELWSANSLMWEDLATNIALQAEVPLDG